jgi:hypothetical protein
VHATGISGVVYDKEAIFVEAIENSCGRGIEVIDPADVVLVADPSSGYTDTLLHLEAALRKSARANRAKKIGWANRSHSKFTDRLRTEQSC